MDTGFLSELNWLHIAVAALAYFALGAIWYSVLFRNAWIRYHAIDVNDPSLQKGTAGIMLVSLLWMFVTTTALAILVNRMQLNTAASGIRWGLLTGVCFSAASVSITYLYLKKSPGLHLIDGLYHVAGQILAAVILCVWQ